MKREIRVTDDGSHTLYVEGLDETYHSIYGAIQESKHVFIRQGLLTVEKSCIRVLELGLGTGLNLLLTFLENLRLQRKLFYHSVEKYPLERTEYRKLNYGDILQAPEEILERIHDSPWHQKISLDNNFTLLKENRDFRKMQLEGIYDLIYFDAFAPSKQPELWTSHVFSQVSEHMRKGGILVTYTSKGEVRRVLKNNGFEVSKVPGPPGKREMIRAVRR